MNTSDVFNSIYHQNRKRIHYHIHALNIRDTEQECLQVGSIALWQAYRQYDPDRGPMSTYFNAIIRHRLIDHIRKSSRQNRDIPSDINNLPASAATGRYDPSTRSLDDLIFSSLTTNHYLLDFIQTRLTYHQWRWFKGSIINDQTTREIADRHQTSPDAVKSWRRQARKKLNAPAMRDVIERDIS